MSSQNSWQFIDPGFSTSLFSVFEEMRLTGEHCDVRIKAGDKSFLVHRVILAGRIPYFTAMFVGHFAESTKDEVTLEDVDPDALRCFIDFVYTGKLNITAENVEILLRNAIYLRFDSATDGCFRFLLRGMEYNNLLLIRRYACIDNRVNVIEEVDRHLRENFDEFVESQAFLSLDYAVLKTLLSRDDLQVTSEEVVFEAALKWVKANEKERIVHLQDILGCVRVPLLSHQYLKAHVCSETLIQSYGPCENILHEIKKYLCAPAEKPVVNWFNSRERYCKEKHYQKCAKAKGSSLYCVGMSDENEAISVQYYDCLHNNWVNLYDNVLQLFRLIPNLYVVSTEENLYFITPDSIVTVCLKTLERICTKHSYDMPSRSEITLWNGEVYFFPSDGDASSPFIYCLSLQERTFEQVGEMVVSRRHHGVASSADYIYVTGGSHSPTDEDDRYEAFLKSAERFNPATGESDEIEPMLVGRHDHGCAVLAGKLYVCGGRVKRWRDTQFHHSCEVYDPLMDEWNFMDSLSRGGCASLLLYGGKLCAFGVDFDDEFPFEPLQAEVYDPSDGEWKPPDFMPLPELAAKAMIVTNAAKTIVL